MDAFSSYFESRNGEARWESLKNFHQISPVVQSHLKQVRSLIFNLFSPVKILNFCFYALSWLTVASIREIFTVLYNLDCLKRIAFLGIHILEEKEERKRENLGSPQIKKAFI